MRSTEGSVPEGRMTITQCLNAGAGVLRRLSPEGTADGCRDWTRSGDLSRPFGTYLLLTVGPNVETLSYYQASLRDELPRSPPLHCKPISAVIAHVR